MRFVHVRSAPPSADLARPHHDPIAVPEALHALADARDLREPLVPADKHDGAALDAGKGEGSRLGGVHPLDDVHVRRVYGRQDEAHVHRLWGRRGKAWDGEGTHDIRWLAVLGVDDDTVRLVAS